MKSLNIGDFIQCRDKNDMVDTMMELAENGYDTDFVYQRDGKMGYWLKVEDYTADTLEAEDDTSDTTDSANVP